MAPPKAILFDIGGVCVVSPFQAIVDYEKAHNIPPDWVNFAISRSSTHGAWQRLERGEIPLDQTFFDHFRRDLHNPAVWEQYHTTFKHHRKRKAGSAAAAAAAAISNPQNPVDAVADATTTSPTSTTIPPLPSIDSTTLFWAMMAVSRTPDPHMAPAVRALSASGRFVVGALSNTVIFPSWHPYAAAAAAPSSSSTTSSSSSPGTVSEADIRAGFDVFVSSAHEGMRKPSREIYELAVRRLDEFARRTGKGGIRAEDVLFLDDIGANLKAAKEVGMRTIKVWLGRTDEAVRELERETGLVLSGTGAEEAGKARL